MFDLNATVEHRRTGLDFTEYSILHVFIYSLIVYNISISNYQKLYSYLNLWLGMCFLITGLAASTAEINLVSA